MRSALVIVSFIDALYLSRANICLNFKLSLIVIMTLNLLRRVCPGQHLAEKSAWLAIACILSVFDVKQPLNEHGTEILPDFEEFSSGSSV